MWTIILLMLVTSGIFIFNELLVVVFYLLVKDLFKK